MMGIAWSLLAGYVTVFGAFIVVMARDDRAARRRSR